MKNEDLEKPEGYEPLPAFDERKIGALSQQFKTKLFKVQEWSVATSEHAFFGRDAQKDLEMQEVFKQLYTDYKKLRKEGCNLERISRDASVSLTDLKTLEDKYQQEIQNPEPKAPRWGASS